MHQVPVRETKRQTGPILRKRYRLITVTERTKEFPSTDDEAAKAYAFEQYLHISESASKVTFYAAGGKKIEVLDGSTWKQIYPASAGKLH